MRADLYRTGAMELTLCEQISAMCCFRRREGPEVFRPPVDHDLRFPTRASGFMHPEKTACVIGPRSPLVSRIPALCHDPEIFDTVVACNAVDVIDDAFGGGAIHVEQRKTMGFVPPAEQPDAQVPAHITARLLADLDAVARAYTPGEYTGLWVVIKKFAQTFCGELSFAHDAVLLRQLMGSGAPWVQPRRTAPL